MTSEQADGQEAEKIEARQRWMGVLAKAQPDELEAAWTGLATRPIYEFLRRPEIGLLMTQGRMGGDGRAFNLGEITVTRCSVKVQDGAVGHAVVTGRAPRHAELAATLDALLQDDTLTAYLEKTVIGPLAVAHAKRRDEVARKAAATRVEFFTLVRAAAS